MSTINIFGCSEINKNTDTPRRGPPGVGFKLTEDSDYDLEGRRLTNLSDPIHSKDAVTLDYYNSLFSSMDNLRLELTNAVDSLATSINEVDTKSEKSIGDLRAQLNDLDTIVMDETRDKPEYACETIIFMTKGKLKQKGFPFVLGLNASSTQKTGFVMPYNGSIKRVILTSQDLKEFIEVNIFVNGEKYNASRRFTKQKDDYFTLHKDIDIKLKEGDILQVEADSNTSNATKLHTVQIFLKYDLIDDDVLLNDVGGGVIASILRNMDTVENEETASMGPTSFKPLGDDPLVGNDFVYVGGVEKIEDPGYTVYSGDNIIEHVPVVEVVPIVDPTPDFSLGTPATYDPSMFEERIDLSNPSGYTWKDFE